MSLVAIAKVIVREGLDQIASEIEAEYKAEVSKTIKNEALSTGRAVGSIHIEAPNATTRLVGGNDEHLFFFEMGNDQQYKYFGGKANKASPNYSGDGAMLLRFRDGTRHVSARTYKGRQCNVKVAARHGG